PAPEIFVAVGVAALALSTLTILPPFVPRNNLFGVCGETFNEPICAPFNAVIVTVFEAVAVLIFGHLNNVLALWHAYKIFCASSIAYGFTNIPIEPLILFAAHFAPPFVLLLYWLYT